MNFCSRGGHDPTQFDSTVGINFLASLAKEKRPIGSILLHRTAISTTWRLIHPNKPNFGEVASQSRLLKGLSRRQGKSIKEPIWDTEKIVQFISESRGSNE